MKSLIIACGNYGATVKAANILSRRLEGEVVVFDPNNGNPPSLSDFDNIILGGNVRMGRLNKNFRRWSKKLKKAGDNTRVYAYMLCGFSEKSDGYLAKAKKLLPFARRVYYVGGILSAENVSGFWANVIIDAREGLKKAGKPLPTIDKKRLEELATEINGSY